MLLNKDDEETRNNAIIIEEEEEQKVDDDDDDGSGSSNSSTANKAGAKRRVSVTFDTVEIREYSRCLGNNPSTLYGPPLSIDWDYTTKGSFRLDDDDDDEPSGDDDGREDTKMDGEEEGDNTLLRRSSSSNSCYVPPEQRTAILLEQSNTTIKQINDITREIRLVQRDRQMSISMSEFDGWNLFVESLQRKLKRYSKGILTKKREQQLLWEKAAKRKQHPLVDEDCSTRTTVSDSFHSVAAIAV